MPSKARMDALHLDGNSAAGLMAEIFSVDVTDEGKKRTGVLVEYDETTRIFTNPGDKRTEDYVTWRFG